MYETDTRELINLEDGITTRLDKATAMLSVLRDTETSHFNDQMMHEYIQTVQDLIIEARNLQGELWRWLPKQ